MKNVEYIKIKKRYEFQYNFKIHSFEIVKQAYISNKVLQYNYCRN